MSTRIVGSPRWSTKFVAWLAALASFAALLAALIFSAPAKANHTIRPGWLPGQLNPFARIASGVPRADPFVSTPATRCVQGPHAYGAQGGTYLLWRYLEYWWPRGENWGIYNCRLPSLHSEGRAVDFHLDVVDPADKAAGHAIFGFFLRTVSGKDAVMARRWGIQEIIYDCTIWTVNGGLRRYSRCVPGSGSYTTNRTLRHEDHIHVGQNPYGAGGYTTAYTGYRPNH